MIFFTNPLNDIDHISTTVHITVSLTLGSGNSKNLKSQNNQKH
jgi:hypothetical protein